MQKKGRKKEIDGEWILGGFICSRAKRPYVVYNVYMSHPVKMFNQIDFFVSLSITMLYLYFLFCWLRQVSLFVWKPSFVKKYCLKNDKESLSNKKTSKIIVKF